MSRLAPSDTEAEKIAAVSQVLDRFHTAASQADGETYFSLFAEDGIFLGSDKSERWSVEAFKAYAAPSFSAGRGWTYVMNERHINITPDGQTAWFDELLKSETYGTSRGTGVLIRVGSSWKISQYHLTFPMPNPLAGEFTTRIKAWERQQNQ